MYTLIGKGVEGLTKDFTIYEQDEWAMKWEKLDFDNGNQIQESKPHWEAELLKLVNSILTTSQVSPSALSALINSIETFSLSLVLSNSATGIKDKDNISALISMIHTITTRYSKIIIEKGLKKNIVNILTRFPTSVVAKNAILIIQKI